MNRRVLCEWLPLDDGLPKLQHFKRHRDWAIRELQANYSKIELITEGESIELWRQIIERIDLRLGSKITMNCETYLYDYLRPHGTIIETLPPVKDKYAILVEEFPDVAFTALPEELPPLESLGFAYDLYIVPASRPTWIIPVSHETGWLLPFLFDLRKG